MIAHINHPEDIYYFYVICVRNKIYTHYKIIKHFYNYVFYMIQFLSDLIILNVT